MTSNMYDPDDVCKRSPPLEAIKPNYGEDKPSTPPFVPAHEKKDAAGQSRKHQPEPHSTHEGDRVLMGYLAPNAPHLALAARDHPLEQKRPQPPDFIPPKPVPPVGIAPRLKELDQGPPAAIEVRSPEGALQFPQAPRPDGLKDLSAARDRLNSIGDLSRRPSSDFSKSPPDLKHRLSVSTLKPIDASCLAKSPDSTQTLPSIQKALKELPDFGPAVNSIPSPYPYSSLPGSAVSGTDSPYPFPGKFSMAASPYPSHISPISMKDSSTNPSPASQASFWRAPEMMSAQTPYEASRITATSPATSYPTPTEQVGVGMGDRVSLATPNGGTVGSYKCTHPGCTAAPFQTQYLLNSHANVHSQDRPHFCPVEGCPRSLGGKGFKRKNEMMRHGLVHNSPGYVCPFCPDQQHKYPRPDNLQRHVRVHHVDKNKDDPILRQVLAQRPMGSARGRKRRMN
ncbi:unnamed protein product [Penicillium olsonii]|uniref:C2H2-type domain-containing protein n=1 Tax=Penicillium olsonii TaxID=99116 RepID=A0A9W4MRV7_PENOL|nr:unnamed protein product [Penicillium olsonii]CAG7933945.1 unnamed protein product [Penicillium olsonii]CAG8061242.1 unnamed protein product [Penicillium olsonii]CAG8092054.1 unnamed protein product [Penicillium olsonii]CAG8287213.1 unnamed protein product [Penicillium olsonii]